MANQKKPGARRVILVLVALCALCGAILAGFGLIRMWREPQRHEAQQAALQAEVIAAPTPAPAMTPAKTPAQPVASPSPSPSHWFDPYARQPDRSIDFEALRQRNRDVEAWLTVPGTAVDYPVVFAPLGNEWYLDHDLDDQPSKYGAIFFDGHNRHDFSDPVTVIYGHNMKDGSMFASLHNFQSAEFFEQNRVIRLYVEDHMLEYEIIAAYKTGDTHLVAEYDFSDEAVFGAYLEEIYSIRDLSAKLRQRALTTDDRLIVLATCVKGEDEARYLVQGVLTKNG